MSCSIPALYLVGPGFRLGQEMGPSEIYRGLSQSFQEIPAACLQVGHCIFLALTFEFGITSLYRLIASFNEQYAYNSFNK